MAFFENLGKKVGEAAQAVSKKSSELVEITKLNVNINAEEDKIQKLLSQIGKLVYEKFASTGAADNDVRELCETIAGHEQTINELKEKIAQIKGTKQCINCGTEMERTQIFCSKCGTKNEIVEAPAEEAPAEEAQTVACPSCNTQLPVGTSFCTNCGTKIE